MDANITGTGGWLVAPADAALLDIASETVIPDTGTPDVAPASQTVTFSNGKAVGALTGTGWVRLGGLDTLTTPTCDATSRPITAVAPCASTTNWSSANGLCISGSIPALPASPVQADYDNNWGVQVGTNASDAAGTPPLGGSYASVALTFSGSPSTGLRAVLHLKGDAADSFYCYDGIVSGKPINLTSFITTCWDGATCISAGCRALTADAAKNIDKLGIEVSSTASAINVSNLCLTMIQFNVPMGPGDATPDSGTKGGLGGVTSSGGTVGTGGTTGSSGAAGSGGATSSGGTSSLPPAVDCTDVSDYSTSIAAQYGTASISLTNDPNKSYIMQANWWGTPYSAQSETLSGLGFTIANPSNAVTSNPSNPLGYPSIYIGSYGGRTTKGSNLPKQVSALTTVPTIISTNVDQKGSASYNAAYDVWFTAGSAALGKSDVNPGAGGAYLMVWLFMPSDKQPRGSIKLRSGTVDGVPGDWDVWYDGTNPPCVSYVAATKTPSLAFDLNNFIKHAIKNSLGVTSAQYLSAIFAGFEVWGGGDGVQLKQFCANVK